MAKNTRGRAKRNAETRDKRPHAIARYIRISSSKVAIVLDLIRGKDYLAATTVLMHANKSACRPILKVLNSAAANAENNLNMPKDNLFVAECWATSGPIMKRMMPRAKGRGDRILKRTSHITVILDERESGIKVEPKLKTRNKTVAVKDIKTAAEKPATKTSAKANIAKETPAIETIAEKPIAKAPNAKKPLGEKKEVTTKKPVSKSTATAKPKTTPAATRKPAAKKEGA